jgi:hypothetical protein
VRSPRSWLARTPGTASTPLPGPACFFDLVPSSSGRQAPGTNLIKQREARGPDHARPELHPLIAYLLSAELDPCLRDKDQNSGPMEIKRMPRPFSPRSQFPAVNRKEMDGCEADYRSIGLGSSRSTSSA